MVLVVNNTKGYIFIELSVCHLPTKWENHCVTFGMTAQTTQKTCWKVLSICAPILKEAYVRDVSMDSFLNVEISLHNNYKYAYYDTD